MSGTLAAVRAVAPETPVPDGSFPLKNSGMTESERQAEAAEESLPTEEPDVPRSFPLESSGIVGDDLNTRRSFPMENSGVTGWADD